MKTVDLTNYRLLRPEKIRWYFPAVHTEEEALSKIKSKSLRSFLRRLDDELEKTNCRYEIKKIDKHGFIQWLLHYAEIMEEDGYDIIAKEEWFDEKLSEGKEVWCLYMYSQGTLVGTNILTVRPEKKLISAFKTSKKNVPFSNMKNASLGAAQDFLVVRFALTLQLPLVSFGQSRNAFGVINSVGQLEYKLKFGLVPSPALRIEYLPSAPLNQDLQVLCFCLDNNILALYTFSNEDQLKQAELVSYLPEEIPHFHLNITA